MVTLTITYLVSGETFIIGQVCKVISCTRVEKDYARMFFDPTQKGNVKGIRWSVARAFPPTPPRSERFRP